MKEYIQFNNALKGCFTLCPCCNKIYRLSDSHLILDGKKPNRDWMDKIDEEIEKLNKQEAIIKDKLKVKRDQAIIDGRLAADKAVSQFDPIFKPLNLNPNDSKVVMHPIDFIVFNGMNDNVESPVIKNIVLLDKKTNNRPEIQESVREVIENERYEFQTIKVDDNGNVVVN